VGDALRLALLAGQPDALDPGHALARAQVANELVDPALERRRVAERGEIDHRDRLAGVGGGREVAVEVEHVLAHRRAVERAGEQADDQREAVALVAADRQQEAFVGTLRVEQRPALAVDHPAFGHRLASLRLRLDLAIRGDRGRHVEHDRRLVARGDGDRDRVGRQQHVEAAPRRQVIGVADREVETDHVALQRHSRVERRRAGVVAEARAGPADPGALRLLGSDLRGTRHDQVPHGVVAVDERRRRALLDDADLGMQVDAAGADPLQVGREADHAVAVGALQVGLGHQRGDRRRIGVGHADGDEGARDEVAQRLGAQRPRRRLASLSGLLDHGAV
jgi:hypothetical protein